MRRADGVGQGNHQREDPRQRQAVLADHRVERLAVDQLHREEEHAIGFFHRVDGDDVRMVERGNALRFALESGAAVRVRGGGLRQNLDRDRAIQPGITGAIDLAHCARAERRHDFVRTEPTAGGQGHLARRL
jgi:hypothetical protein